MRSLQERYRDGAPGGEPGGQDLQETFRKLIRRFAKLKNLFIELMPHALKYKDLIGVYDVSDRGLKIMSDVVSQKIICFSDEKNS